MKCILCNHPLAAQILAALADGTPDPEIERQFSLSPHEIHAHRQVHATQSPLTTPQGEAAFKKATREDQLFMTLDAVRAYLVQALAGGQARQVLPATRLFLNCQAQIDRSIDPLTEEHRLRRADRRHKLLTEREQLRKKDVEREVETQATVRLMRAHPELFDEWDFHMDAIRKEEEAA